MKRPHPIKPAKFQTPSIKFQGEASRIQLDTIKAEHKGGHLDTSSDSEIQTLR